MTDLERTNAELRSALIVAGRQIVKLNFGPRKNDPILRILQWTICTERRAGSRAMIVHCG